MLHRLLALAFILAASCPAHADGILISWGPNDLKGMSRERFEACKTWTISEILERVRHTTDWPEVYLTLVAANHHKDDAQLLDSLVSLVANPGELTLTNTSRLIIWERISADQIMFEGKGIQVDDDLFRIGGRANWLLRQLSDLDPGHVHMATTDAALGELAAQWREWRKGGKLVAYADPCPTEETGMSEIHSIEALQALILSLRPSAQKDALTKDCLKRLYDLDSLPEDPAEPASLCSPDNYTHGYLALLTEVKDRHTAEWWATWWGENGAHLIWRPTDARFEVKG